MQHAPHGKLALYAIREKKSTVEKDLTQTKYINLPKKVKEICYKESGVVRMNPLSTCSHAPDYPGTRAPSTSLASGTLEEAVMTRSPGQLGAHLSSHCGQSLGLPQASWRRLKSGAGRREG